LESPIFINEEVRGIFNLIPLRRTQVIYLVITWNSSYLWRSKKSAENKVGTPFERSF